MRQGINPSKYEDETFIHYSIPAFDSGCMPTLEQGESIKSNKYLVFEESILLSKLNPRIPRVWLPFSNKNYQSIASTEFLVIEPKQPINRSFLFIMFQSSEFSDKFVGLALGTSTSHQRVKPNDFLGMNILLPSNFILEHFDNLASGILSQTNNLRLKNHNLRQTRDFLLPKLISGEIDVEDLDIDRGIEEDVPWK